eukprot:15459902-Alexandrium_andersonii.AAC.1
MIIGISVLPNFPGACPIVPRAPVLAPWARALTPIYGPGSEAGAGHGAAGRWEAGGLVGIEGGGDGRDAAASSAN